MSSTSPVAGAACAPPCTFSGTGRVGGPTFAAARTGDDTVWLAYVTSAFALRVITLETPN